MTGHLFNAAWDGDQATLTARNEQIRTYCRDHHEVLYDFADIEGYDLGGALHADATDACEWCPSSRGLIPIDLYNWARLV